MQLLQPDEESCRSEILHARVYGLGLSKGIARAEIFFAGLKKNRVRTDGGRTLVAYSNCSIAARTRGIAVDSISIDVLTPGKYIYGISLRTLYFKIVTEIT